MKKLSIENIFLSLMAVFILLSLFSFVPFPHAIKRPLFLVAAILVLVFLVLGISLVFKARKKKGKLKFFLILTGISAILPLAGTLLHNFFYALAVTFVNYAAIFEFLHATFFILSILVAPILFLVGIIGTALLLPLKKDRKKWLIVSIVITLLIILASNLLVTHDTLESEKFTLKYPENYFISEDSIKDKHIIIEKEEGGERIEIYDTDEYDFELIHGFSSSGLEEFESELVPKEKITIDNYEIWLFYHKDSTESKDTLHKIVDSIKFK